MTTRITEANIEENTLNTITGGIRVEQIIATDSEYVPLETNQLSTSGGFVKIIGRSFRENSQVHIQSGNTYILASSITFVNPTELRSQFPPRSAGTYNVVVTRNDGAFAIKVNGITYA